MYIQLENSCLLDIEKKEVIDMLYMYKDVFTFRDEIGNMSQYIHVNRCYR